MLKITNIFLFGFLFTLPIILSEISPYSNISVSAFAEEEKERKYENIKAKRRQTIGQRCASRLDKANDFIEEEDWAAALEILDKVEDSSKTCKSGYEKATVWRFKGLVYISMEDVEAATIQFENAVNAEGTPEDLKLDMRYALAQLYMMQDRFAEAAVHLKTWIEQSSIVSSPAYALLARNYYQLDRKDEALENINIAIDGFESKGKIPRENWWVLQLGIYHEKGDSKKVTDVLEKIVKYYPKWTYWRQLSQAYAVQERPSDSLVAGDLLYMNDELNKESELKRLAIKYLANEAPYKAAQIIAKGLNEKKIEPTEKTLRLLGDAWFYARELKLALKAYEEASEISNSGDTHARLARIYLNLGMDKKAYQASLKAEDKGNLKQTSSNYIAMGTSLLNLYCFKDAIDAFQNAFKAAERKQDKRSSKNLIKYAEIEDMRLGDFRDYGAEVPNCRK